MLHLIDLLVRHVRDLTPEVVGGLVGYFLHNIWHGLYHKLDHGLHLAITRIAPRLARGGH